MALNHIRWAGAAGLLFCTILQVILVGGIQSDAGRVTTPTDSTLPPSGSHGIEKRSVSILARNGDLPYYRKEWNKKLHPGFRGMNVENKDESTEVDKRYVGALARGGGFPMGTGKRSLYRYNSITGILPEEAILEAYLADELRQKLLQRELAAESDELNVATEGGFEEDPETSNEFAEKRGGVGSLARGGYMPSEGRYSSGKRSLAALARSGEILSIGRGSSHDRDGGNGANKRGFGSLLRNGGISTIGKIPVYNVGSPINGKRGIESLARNYALPSMLNQEYAKKYDLIDDEDDDISSIQLSKPSYKELETVDENEDASGIISQEDMIKRHLGSFARTYGLRPSNKRNIGSVVRNVGGMFHNGKRSEENSPQYDEDYFVNNKRHISSLLRNQGSYLTAKREGEDRYESGDAEKRHLASILHDRNSFVNGKRYLGSIARQGLLGVRPEKRENLEGIYDDGQWSRGDFTVGKRSIAEEDSGSRNGEISFNQQEGGSGSNGTTEDELKNAASPISSVAMKKRSTEQRSSDGTSSEKEKSKSDRPSSTHRQRRSLAVPYSNSDEYPMPVMQNTDFYDLETADEDELTGAPDKRFMGSLARWGWFPRQFRREASRDEEGGVSGAVVRSWDDQSWTTPPTYQLHKRHIGALARLGWLPAIRSQRRYSRGLGKRSIEEDGGGREDTTYGTQSTKNRYPFPIAYTPEAPISLNGGPNMGWPRREIFPLDDASSAGVELDDGWRIGADKFGDGIPHVLTEKRYLLLPAIDHLLLRKLYPRQMLPLLV